MRYRELALPLGVFAFAVAVVIYSWTGYTGSDDNSYFAGGLGWLNDLSYVGTDHWTLRHTLVIPMAVAFAAFGITEFSLVLPVLIYYFLLLALLFVLVRRHFGEIPAAICVLLVACTPLVATTASVMRPDLAETFFCLLSLALFFEATRGRRPATLLILAGFAAGFGWLTRETVVFFLVTYGVLFLFGYGVGRLRYLLVALGFFAVVGAEFLYFSLTASSPLHRIQTDLQSHLDVEPSEGLEGISGDLTRSTQKVEEELYGVLSRTGNLSVHRLVDPFLVVLLNQEFVFTYYLAVPAAIWLWLAYRKRSGAKKEFVRVFGLAGLVWFLFLWLQVGMSLLPRYYTLPTVVLVTLLSIWLYEVVAKRSTILAVAVIGFLFLTNLIGVYVDNRDPDFGEQAVAEYLSENDGILYTDPETAKRGRFRYMAADVAGRVVAEVPPPGGLFLYNPRYVALGMMQGGTREARARRLEALAKYQPREQWQEVRRWDAGRLWTGRIIDVLGMKPLVPPEIYRRLDRPNPPVVLYRVS